MADLQGFNANDVEPAEDFSPLPAGKYLAAVIESEWKVTKTGSGRYLQLTFQVLDGEYKNRLLWARFNLENASATAVKIARSELSALCRAVDVIEPQDSIELHDLPVLVIVKLKKRPDTGELDNEIGGYSPRNPPPPSAPAAPPTAPSRPVAPPYPVATVPPWKRS